MNAKEILDRCTFYLRIDVSNFSREIGIEHTELLRIISVPDSILPDHIIEAIIARYPEFTRTWLMYGQGEMFSDVGVNRLPTERRGNYEIIDVYGNRKKLRDQRLREKEAELYKGFNSKGEDISLKEQIKRLEEIIEQKDRQIALLVATVKNNTL